MSVQDVLDKHSSGDLTDWIAYFALQSSGVLQKEQQARDEIARLKAWKGGAGG